MNGFPKKVRGGQVWTDGTTWQASDSGGWLPGIYADEVAARKALRVAKTRFGGLEAIARAEVRGIGPDYRPITVDDLRGIEDAG